MKKLSKFWVTIVLVTIMMLAGVSAPSGTAYADSTNYESFTAGSVESTLTYAFGDQVLSQSFIAGSNHNINAVSLKLLKQESGGAGTIYASIRATEKKTFTVDEKDYELDIPKGVDLAFGSISESSVGDSTPGWYQINFNKTIQLTQNKAYAIVLSAPACTNPIAWRAAIGYSDGNAASGSSWSDTWSSADPFYDFLFQVIGDPLITGDVPTATGTGVIDISPDKGFLDPDSIQTLALEDLPQDAQDSLLTLGDVQFTHGFFKFNITGLTPGDSVDVTITLPQTISGTVTYRKYTDHWFTVPCWRINDTTIVITLTDGGTGDDDLIADGTICDDGGPAEPPVVAGFSATPLSGASPLEVQFTDESIGNVTSWEWDFDNDGNVDSTDQDPVHFYDFTNTANSQVFTPRLTIIVDGGGTDSLVRDNYITIYRPPVADFTATPTSGFPPLDVTFTRQTSGYISDILWDFGDGSTTTDWNPGSHTYAAAGNYNVSLTASSFFGTDTETKIIEVYGSPQADFTATPDSGAAPLTVQFADLSLGGPTTWQWDFDNDGTIDSTDQDPGYTYTTPGIYTVKLTVEGGDTETKTNYITVFPPTIPHLYEHWNDSDADDNTQYYSGTYLAAQTFTAQEDHSVTSVRLKLYRLSSLGTVEVALRSSLGGNNLATGTIDGSTITASSLGAWYDIPLSPTINLDSGNSYALVLISSSGTVAWKCDNSSSFDYPGGGAYYGLPWSAYPHVDFKFEIHGAQLIDADFSASPVSGPAPLTVDFTDQTSGSTPSWWLWDFGDGGASTSQNPTHVYTTPGTYTVSLTIDGIDTETKTDYITVEQNEPPVADAGGPYTGTEGTAVVFDGSGSGDVDGTIATWEWDFESDGTFDVNSASPAASFTWYDDYSGDVTLRVTDDKGLATTGTVGITITNVAPSVDAGADQTAGTLQGVSFSGSFTDPGTLDTHSIDWDFGDGGTAAGNLNVTHAYAASGTYTVTLTVTDDNGGIGTDTLAVTVTSTSGGSPGGGSYIPMTPDEDEDEVTEDEPAIGPPEPAVFKVGNINIDTGAVYEGDTLTIDVQITNSGGAAGSYPLQLQIDGVTIETRTITVSPGETRTVTFNIVVRQPGMHLVGIGDMSALFEVLAVEKAVPVTSHVVSALSITPAQAGPGEKVVISATITNDGNLEFTDTCILYVNGDREDSRDVTIDPGNSAVVSFEVSREYDGVYIVAIGPESGAFTIQSPPETEVVGEIAGIKIEDEDTGLGAGGLIAIIVATVLVIALASGLLYSRRRD